jgi:hypothetical protein
MGGAVVRITHVTDGTNERTVLIGAITSKEFLSSVNSRCKDDPFASKWCNIIFKWCLEHFRTTGEAPMNRIENYYADMSERNRDDDACKLIGDLLSSLSGEYERNKDELNHNFLIKKASQLFRKVALEKLAQAITDSIRMGKLKEAESLVEKHRRVEMGMEAPIDLLTDMAALESVFSEDNVPIIEYPGHLGKFVRNAFCRGCFVAWLAPNKSGKSFVLEDVAWRALCQRRRVAYFQVGDMSQNDVVQRFAIRAAQVPRWSETGFPCEIEWPEELILEGDRPTIKSSILRFDEPLNLTSSKKAFASVQKKIVRSGQSYFKMWNNPATTATWLISELDKLEGEDWVPDVICLDYMDNLSPFDRKIELKRDQINADWHQLSSLRLQRDYLICTATQSNKRSFAGGLMTKDNITDDRRKLDHVSGMIGLNIDNDDKREGLVRWNWINLRSAHTEPTDICWVAPCLDLVDPCATSNWPKMKKGK